MRLFLKTSSMLNHLVRTGLLLGGLSLFLAACSSTDKDEALGEDITVNGEETPGSSPVEELYNEAANLLAEEEYEDAARAFEKLDQEHPYSIWATKAQLMAAFSWYQDQKYEDALIALNRFIELHPGNRYTAYAYYLRAMCFYERISDVTRDQSMTAKALQALDDIVKRYPDTSYARDARFKLDLARDHLAGKEMDIGRFYLRKGEFLAAINRFRTVVEKYQVTTHVPEALHRLVEAYLSLGVYVEAQRVGAVLGYNYPDSIWYKRSYALLSNNDLEPHTAPADVDEEHWYERLWHKLF